MRNVEIPKTESLLDVSRPEIHSNMADFLNSAHCLNDLVADIDDLSIGLTEVESRSELYYSATTSDKNLFIEKVAELMDVRRWGDIDFWIDLEESLYSSWCWECTDFILSKIDFENVKNFASARNYLELIRSFFDYGHSPLTERTVEYEKMAQNLSERCNSNNANYLLSLWAKRTVASITRPAKSIEEFMDDEYESQHCERGADDPAHRMMNHTPGVTSLPFLVAPQIFGIMSDDGLLLSDADDYEMIDGFFQNFNNCADKEFIHFHDNDEHFIDYAEPLRHDFDSFENNTLNERAYREASEWLERLNNKISVKFEFPSVRAYEGLNISQSQMRQQMLRDFSLLVSVEMSEEVREEFGVEIKKLSIKEQFYFLNYIKGVTNQSALKVKKFVRLFGENGLKTFLSLEFGQDMGDVILAIGAQLESQPDIANKLFQKYAEMIDAAEDIADMIIKATAKKDSMDRNEIVGNLLFTAKELLSAAHDSLANDAKREKFILSLEKINSKISLTDQLLRQLPREQVAELDLRQLESVERLEEIPAAELLKNRDLLDKIKSIIKQQFPAGDDETFEAECRSNKNLRLTVALANNEVLSFFSKESMSENVEYIDWFIANPDAPIKGLGEATLRLGFKEDDAKSYYAVVKPHVKSFNVLVEKIGFVSIVGSTLDGEYHDHYARIRKVPSDKYLESKKLNEAELLSLANTVRTICLETEKVESFIYKGRRLDLAKVVFHGQDHKTDIRESDPDGWIFSEIGRQYKNGRVLSRFIPESNTKDNQVFYAVFESDPATKNETAEIDKVIDYKLAASNSHSASKKTRSN